MARLIVREVSDYPGHYEYVHDGRESSSYYDSRDAAIDAYFSPYAWPGGYPVEYYYPGAGAVICAACAKQEWLDSEDGEAADGYVADGDPSSTGVMCDGCNEWIVEPVCVQCDRPLTEVRRPLFVDAAQDMIVCTACMAQLVCKGEASKVGKQTYAIDRQSAWYAHSNPFTSTHRWNQSA